MQDSQEPLELKQTINLPKTSFSMKANLPQNEPKWLAAWTKENLYGQIARRARTLPFSPCTMARLMRTGASIWARRLNKILKDFIVKMKSLEGV